MTKNAQYISNIRSFYAKNTFKREGNRWVKQYEVVAGIVIVRCIPLNKCYFAKSTNIRRTVSKWRGYLRSGNVKPASLKADVEQYGLDAFEVVAGEALWNVPEEYIKMRLDMLFRSYVEKHDNIYNKFNVVKRYLPLYERAKWTALGGTTGRSNQQVDRTSLIKGSVIYVITNKVTQKHLVGAVNDFERYWFALHSQLRRGTFRDAELQADWNQYGEESFVADFYRCDSGDLRKIKALVLRSIGNVYGNKRIPGRQRLVDRGGELAG